MLKRPGSANPPTYEFNMCWQWFIRDRGGRCPSLCIGEETLHGLHLGGYIKGYHLAHLPLICMGHAWGLSVMPTNHIPSVHLYERQQQLTLPSYFLFELLATCVTT